MQQDPSALPLTAPAAAAHPYSSQQQVVTADALPAATTVLRLRGLPYSATDVDVRQFFTGFELAASEAPILIVTQGFHRGEGYVRFIDEQTCSSAYTTRNRAMMRERYIELYPSNDTAFETAFRQQQQLAQEVHHVIRMRGLPFAAQPDTIRVFFEHLAPQIVNIVMCSGQDGRFTGDAFVDFATADAMRESIGFDRRMIGTRYVEIFESSAQERDAVLMSARRHIRGRGGWDPTRAMMMRGGGGGAAAMMMMGHPAAAGGYAMMGQPPHHAYSGAPRGRGSAAHHHQQQMMAMMYTQPVVAAPQTAAVVPSVSSSVVRVRGLPFSSTEADVAEFLRGVSIRPQGVHMVYNANERPTGEAFVEVNSDRDVETALGLNRQMLGSRYIEVYRSTPADMMRLQGADPMVAYDPTAAYAAAQQWQAQQAYAAQQWQAFPAGSRR
jgi:RNA recognition motif-containing protein